MFTASLCHQGDRHGGDRSRSSGVVDIGDRSWSGFGEGTLSITADAFRVGAVEWEAGEELGGHATSAADVVGTA